jgi:hypothetical protein
MHMLHWIYGHIRTHRVWNVEIRDKLGVGPFEEKHVQHRLRWFGHIQRRPLEVGLKKARDSTRARGSSTQLGAAREPSRT